jgi:hypoxanthine phosphoribosyltransferase
MKLSSTTNRYFEASDMMGPMIAYRLAEDPLYQPVVVKDEQRLWKRILIVDDEADVTVTFKAVIEEINNNNDVNKKISTYVEQSCRSIIRI